MIPRRKATIILPIGGVHGDDEIKVYGELCQAVEEWILIHQEDGEPLPPETAGREYSGKFVLRAGKELHKKLAIGALLADKSLNSYCVQVLEQSGKRKRGQSE